MNFDKMAGLASAVGILFILTMTAWLGVAGPIWRSYWTASPDQWLGFLGAIIGAVATIVAGALALFAAYQTLKPVKDQLTQLIKQNDQILYDRLRKRCVDLNTEKNLTMQVVGDCAIVNQILETLLNAAGPKPKVMVEFQTAVDGLEKTVDRIKEKRGDLWGDVKTQLLREKFIDYCLAAGAIAYRMGADAEGKQHLMKVLIKPKENGWISTNERVEVLASQLSGFIETEFTRVGIEISAVEKRIFENKHEVT